MRNRTLDRSLKHGRELIANLPPRFVETFFQLRSNFNSLSLRIGLKLLKERSIAFYLFAYQVSG